MPITTKVVVSSNLVHHTLNERIDIEEQRVLVWFKVFNATFNNISAISWQSVLLVEDICEKYLKLNLQLTEMKVLTLRFIGISHKTCLVVVRKTQIKDVMPDEHDLQRFTELFIEFLLPNILLKRENLQIRGKLSSTS
jgi:hypothetical protein